MTGDDLQPGDRVRIELSRVTQPPSKTYTVIALGPFVARLERNNGGRFSANRDWLRKV